jgi:hypothetical protein
MKKNKNIIYLLSLFAFIFFFSCGKKEPALNVPFKRAFYFWKTSFYSSPEQDSIIKDLKVNTLYTKMFEVDWDESRKDVAPIGDFNYSISDDVFYYDSINYIPVVYITNESFIHLNDSQIIQLASRVTKKIQTSINEAALAKLNRNYHYDRYFESEEEFFYGDDNPYRLKSKDFSEMHVLDSIRTAIHKNIVEYQFDCDWTDQTQSKYFLFLVEMKKHLKSKLVSATIRLYQYKYFDKAGVPPVDKGMLMCYNTGDVRRMESSNSIFGKKEVFKFLNTKKDYPMILDYALPIFEWVAVYRNNKIIYLLSPDHFYFNNTDMYQKQEQNDTDIEKYLVVNEHTVGYGQDEVMLKKDDIIKLETPDLSEVASMASKLKSINRNPNPTISLFDFDIKNVKQNEKQIKKIFDSF